MARLYYYVKTDREGYLGWLGASCGAWVTQDEFRATWRDAKRAGYTANGKPMGRVPRRPGEWEIRDKEGNLIALLRVKRGR